MEKLDHVSSRVISTRVAGYADETSTQGIPYPSHLLFTSSPHHPSPPSRPRPCLSFLFLATRTIPSEPPAPLLSTAPRVVISLWLHRSPSSTLGRVKGEGGRVVRWLVRWLAACLTGQSTTVSWWKETDGRNGGQRPR